MHWFPIFSFQKAVVIVVSTDDSKFWVARDDKVPVYAEEFTEIFMKQVTSDCDMIWSSSISMICWFTANDVTKSNLTYITDKV